MSHFRDKCPTSDKVIDVLVLFEFVANRRREYDIQKDVLLVVEHGRAVDKFIFKVISYLARN